MSTSCHVSFLGFCCGAKTCALSHDHVTCIFCYLIYLYILANDGCVRLEHHVIELYDLSKDTVMLILSKALFVCYLFKKIANILYLTASAWKYSCLGHMIMITWCFSLAQQSLANKHQHKYSTPYSNTHTVRVTSNRHPWKYQHDSKVSLLRSHDSITWCSSLTQPSLANKHQHV